VIVTVSGPELISRARRQITHNGDGPITPFVLISRACELSRRGEVPAEVAANALHEELSDRCWLKVTPCPECDAEEAQGLPRCCP
jgi:hypothetical protein